MVWIKGCKRCGGDLVEGMDLDGRVIACVQCGRAVAAVEVKSETDRAPAIKRPPAAASSARKKRRVAA